MRSGYAHAVPRALLSSLCLLWCSATAAQPAAAPGDAAPAASSPPPMQAGETPDPPPAEAAPPDILIAPTVVRGVDPIVGRFVDRQLTRTIDALGQVTLGPAQTRRLLDAAGALAAPSMRDLWAAMHRSGARLAVLAVVWAEHGSYRIDLGLASRDGRGPFHRTAAADATGLEAQVDRMLRELLDALTPAEVAAAPPSVAPPSAPAAIATPIEVRRLRPQAEPQPEVVESLRWLRLALRTDFAFGVGDEGFFNLLIGGRALYRIDRSTAIGGYLAYANVPTRDGRGASALPALAFEHQIDAGTGTLTVPLRMLVGGLLGNGSVLRLSSGLALALGDHTAISFDLLAPTFWVTPDRILLSLDLGVELSVDL